MDLCVCTPDIEHAIFKNYYRSLKSSTKIPIRLKISCNFGRQPFSFSDEMNQFLDQADASGDDFVAIGDDDIEFPVGWAEAALEIFQNENRCGVVGFTIRDRANTDRPITGPTHAIMLYSQLWVLRTKLGVRFDPRFKRYCMDDDFSLRVWEAGFNCVCSPLIVDHALSGKQSSEVQSTQYRDELIAADRILFDQLWKKNWKKNILFTKKQRRYPDLILFIPKAPLVNIGGDAIGGHQLDLFEDRPC